MAREGYTSNANGIDADDLADVIEPVAHTGDVPRVYVVDLASGERTPIVAAMISSEGYDAPEIFLYTEMP